MSSLIATVNLKPSQSNHLRLPGGIGKAGSKAAFHQGLPRGIGRAGSKAAFHLSKQGFSVE
jgi:hypothetical protein